MFYLKTFLLEQHTLQFCIFEENNFRNTFVGLVRQGNHNPEHRAVRTTCWYHTGTKPTKLFLKRSFQIFDTLNVRNSDKKGFVEKKFLKQKLHVFQDKVSSRNFQISACALGIFKKQNHQKWFWNYFLQKMKNLSVCCSNRNVFK